MQDRSKEFIETLTTGIFAGQNISVDTDILIQQIIKYDIPTKELTILLLFVSDNVDFFKTHLNYPLQASNLFLYCMDALKEPEDKWRGSRTRNYITKELQTIINNRPPKSSM